jgi:hypothetical protein
MKFWTNHPDLDYVKIVPASRQASLFVKREEGEY